MEKRIDKINYYLDIAETVASRSTCLRKKYGSVIVNHDQIISTGYSGAPRGRINCSDLGYCTKKKLLPDERHGGYDACRSVHSEQNALISASRQEMIGGILYLVGYRTENHEYEKGAAPCLMCRKLIINAGLEKVIVRVNKTEYKVYPIQDWIDNDEFLNGQLEY
ncbi:MAG: cytidine deaminase [Clostridia bacterium]|jgi:dCMP deaminase|nr:cytidine deaminase [Clostridia bacterium]